MNDSYNINTPPIECSTYKAKIDKLHFLQDMWNGSIAWMSPLTGITDIQKAKAYLPQHSKETDTQYRDRVCRASFDRKFRDAIATVSGFLSSFVIKEDTPLAIKTNIDNIDGTGNSLKNLLRQADQKALRDEHCFILIEFPKQPKDAEGRPIITNARIEQQLGLRPYLVLIDTRQVIDWEHDTNKNGTKYLKRIVIKEAKESSSSYEHQYRILYPGYYEIWEESDGYFVLIEEGSTSIPEIPIVYYSLTDDAVDIDRNDLFGGEPPLYDLAELNLKLFRKESEKDTIMTKVNLPIFVVNELNPVRRRENEMPPPVTVGPNTVLYNVKAEVIEPSGGAIAQTQADIDKLKLEIDKKIFTFQSGSYAPATATEIDNITSANRSRLEVMAAAKEQAVHKIFTYWMQWMSGVNSVGGITIDRRMLQSSIQSSQANLYLTLREKGELSQKGLFELLKKGKILPDDFDIDREISNIKQDQSLDVQKQLASIHDVYLKYQVVDPDEVARSLVLGKPLSEVINLERREQERISIQPTLEGYARVEQQQEQESELASEGESGLGTNLQSGGDDISTGRDS